MICLSILSPAEVDNFFKIQRDLDKRKIIRVSNFMFVEFKGANMFALDVYILNMVAPQESIRDSERRKF